MIRKSTTLMAAAALLALAAAPALAAGELPVPTPNRALMDTTCSPCKDFFRYANGAWLATAEIPPSYVAIGAGREMADRNQAALYRVLEHMRETAATQKDPTLRKLGQLYSVLMDSARADREGLAPFEETKRRLAAVKTIADVQREFARASIIGVGAGMWGGGGIPFRFGAEPDPKNSSTTIAQITQGGLGLPDRDWYFRKDEKSENNRKEYVAFMGRMFALTGDDEATAKRKADGVFALELALAESSLTNVQMRDPKKLYNKITVEELAKLAPTMDWKGYFTAHGLTALTQPGAMLDVSMPGFVRQFDALLRTTPVDTWRDYLVWNQIRSRAGWMGQKAFDEVFAFQSKLTGAKVPEPRWKRANQAVDRSMGEALGKAYVEEYFPESSKKRMLEMVNNLQAALGERIDTRPWMGAETKKQAHHKLSTILKKIGYPDKWRDYSKLEIDPAQPAIVNLERARTFERAYELSWIGKPIDRSLWGLTPPTVNAYYNPTFNEIVFPAGILTPPQFDPRVDDAVNYGAIGMVIGHEITHGFDDEGRQYDAEGNLRDWWTQEDNDRFEALAHKVVEQYDGYVAVDTLRLNGKLTLGENIADLGGITIAYHAWKRSLKGKPAPVIDGFTGEQRFFLGLAQAWRRKYRPESTRLQALSDPHSTAEWRVNGPLSNLTEFRQAFGCKAGDPMVRNDQIVIW